MREQKSIFRRALEISILLHLLLIFLILPRLRNAWPENRASIFAPAPTQQNTEPPLEFEFVDLPNEREETPVSNEVPASDLDRRAHGGEGEADTMPSTAGTTPQLVQADGGQVFDRGAPPSQPNPPTEQVPPPQPEEDDSREKPEDQPRVERIPEGQGEEKEDNPQSSAVPLPPPGTWAAPPDRGGLLEMPDRDGGHVDAGGLSFDTQWYDWGPYAKAMLAKIRRNWHIPELAQMGVSGVVKIRFFIERDGSVTGLAIIDESGKPPMDFAARDAIAYSSKFDPLPPDLTGVLREGVTIAFYYNKKPPTRRRRR